MMVALYLYWLYICLSSSLPQLYESEEGIRYEQTSKMAHLRRSDDAVFFRNLIMASFESYVPLHIDNLAMYSFAMWEFNPEIYSTG